MQGGSTLDMQLIKLSFFSTDSADQNMKVKIQEAWLALQLDQNGQKSKSLLLMSIKSIWRMVITVWGQLLKLTIINR